MVYYLEDLGGGTGLVPIQKTLSFVIFKLTG